MYLIPQPLVLAPPRDDGLLYAVYVDSEEILHFVQNDRPQPRHLEQSERSQVYVAVDGRTDCEILSYAQDNIAYNSSRHCEELHAKAFVIPLTVYAIPWQSTIDYSALLILTQVAIHRH